MLQDERHFTWLFNNFDFLFAVRYHLGIANQTLQPPVILGYIQRVLKLALDTNLYSQTIYTLMSLISDFSLVMSTASCILSDNLLYNLIEANIFPSIYKVFKIKPRIEHMPLQLCLGPLYNHKLFYKQTRQTAHLNTHE